MKEVARSAARQLYQLARHKMVLLLVGGAIGTWLRYIVGKWFGEQSWTKGFPFGTLFINVTGSFILGLSAVIIRERLPLRFQDWYLLVGTGFCGGYTTFSTFELETYQLVVDRSYLHAFGNVALSVGAGFVGVVLGVLIAYSFFPRHME